MPKKDSSQVRTDWYVKNNPYLRKKLLKDNQLHTAHKEFSFWFKDVQWNVENYGTDPDIEVDIAPQDYVANRDPQMDKSIEVILQQMKEKVII